jgi:hypothetical protein
MLFFQFQGYNAKTFMAFSATVPFLGLDWYPLQAQWWIFSWSTSEWIAVWQGSCLTPDDINTPRAGAEILLTFISWLDILSLFRVTTCISPAFHFILKSRAPKSSRSSKSGNTYAPLSSYYISCVLAAQLVLPGVTS